MFLDIAFWLIILIVSLVILIKGSEFFVDNAEKLGLSLKIPSFILGATVIAVGTSLPELLSSITSVLKNSSEIVIGNVIGSNITNILLIIGLSGLMFIKCDLAHKRLNINHTILVSITIILGITIYDGSFNIYEGILFLILLIAYLIYTIKTQTEEKDTSKTPPKFKYRYIIYIIASSFVIYLGAQYTIDALIKLSEILNIAKTIIAISVVAVGTSLPELMVCLVAASQKKYDMIFGNIIGSCIFNILAIMGVSSLFGNLIIPGDIIIKIYPILTLVTILFFLITADKKITRTESIALNLLYILFIVNLFL